MDVAAQVEYVASSLGRSITATSAKPGEPYAEWRIEQCCPVCEAIIGVTFRAREIKDAQWLYRQIFGLYDEHRCRSARTRDELRDRAERESERLADRAAMLRARESHEPPREMPSLYERAERESVVLAEWALEFSRPSR